MWARLRVRVNPDKKTRLTDAPATLENASMTLFGLTRTDNKIDLIVVLEPENIERLQRYDPAEIFIREVIDPRMLNIVMICYATEEDLQHMQALAQAHKYEELKKFATRGFEFRPDLGDHDFGPLRVEPDKKDN